MLYPLKKTRIKENPFKIIKNISEIENQRLSNLKNTISKINQVLLHAQDEKQLYQKICKILINTGNYSLVWIGIFDIKNKKINLITSSGFDKDYISKIRPYLFKEKGFTNPAVAAVKEGKIIIIKNINTSSFLKPSSKDSIETRFKSTASIPIFYCKQAIGSLNLYANTNDSFKKNEMRILREISNDIAIGVRSLKFKNDLECNYFKFKKALYDTIDAIAMISERRDPYTAGHQKRVAMLASAIAKEMKLAEDLIEGIYLTSIIHDIGKMNVPLSILSKPSALSEGEMMLIQSHCQEAYNILKNIEFPWPVAEIILQHHERINGSGYPNKLKGDEISIGAKILAVADTIEAMSSHRPYRPAVGLNKAMKEILKNKGILYDSRVVDTCIDLIKNKKFKFKD